MVGRKARFDETGAVVYDENLCHCEGPGLLVAPYDGKQTLLQLPRLDWAQLHLQLEVQEEEEGDGKRGMGPA